MRHAVAGLPVQAARAIPGCESDANVADIPHRAETAVSERRIKGAARRIDAAENLGIEPAVAWRQLDLAPNGSREFRREKRRYERVKLVLQRHPVQKATF